MEQINVCIRADGNSKIGMGHLMRTLSIAIALKEKQVKVFYITKELESKIFLEEKGFQAYLVTRTGDDICDEIPATLDIIAEQKPKLCLVDTYEASETYLAELNERIPTVYLDDLGRMNLPVSGLINYNIYGNEMGYEQSYSADTQLLLGSKYAPVKPQFLETEYTVSDHVQNIMITMGGSDALNITGQLIDKLLPVLPSGVTITAICGRFNPHLSAMQNLAQTDTRLIVRTDVPDMWNVMAETDLAIASASSTMYELSTLGVPTVCCYYVENQRRIAEGFAKIGVCNAGDFSKNPEEVLLKITNEVENLLQDKAKRKELSTKIKEICDGKGASHIADALLRLVQ